MNLKNLNTKIRFPNKTVDRAVVTMFDKVKHIFVLLIIFNRNQRALLQRSCVFGVFKQYIVHHRKMFVLSFIC